MNGCDLEGEFAPHTFNYNPQNLSRDGYKLESAATLTRLTVESEQMTPNDAVRLAQQLLVGVEAYGIEQGSDFQNPQAVKKYIHKATNALKGLSLS